MSNQISTNFVPQFKDNVMLLAQQKKSRLIQAVINETLVGEEHYFEYVGSTAMVERTSRHGDTPLVETPHERRRVGAKWFDWADLIDKADEAKLRADFTSPYVQAASAAAARKIDKQIILAADGTAYKGKAGGVAVAYDTNMDIAVTVGNGGSGDVGLNVEKLLQAKEKLDAAEVDEDDPRFIVLNAKQLRKLLNQTEVKSADYNTVKALVNGQIDTFVGFKFLRSEQIGLDSNNDDKVLYFTKSGIGLAIQKLPEIKISERADKNYSKQIYACLGMDAARLEETKVGRILCDRS